MGDTMYPHLFSPLQIGALEIKNRIAMAPMGVEIIDDDGEVLLRLAVVHALDVVECDDPTRTRAARPGTGTRRGSRPSWR